MSAYDRVIPILPAAQGREGKIQARTVFGAFARWRWTMLLLTQAFYYGLPWLNLHGRQALLFDLDARRFYLFGAVLYPQDLIYLAGLLVVAALLLFFVTAIAGRIWCGFACPQTVYTSLFMWIEEKLEGSRQNRLRLDASPWSAEKLLRRGGKHFVWAGVGLWTGFTLVGYFTPIRNLWEHTRFASIGPWELFWTGFYGLATYVNAGLVREKVCLHMCPYGRFQGALMDAGTLNVAYDHRRGEPRQRHTKEMALGATSKGACVDCTLCVQVCPTGVDIRAGLQAACIGCGLCIDACNQVMDKLGQARGLIRLASLAELAQPQPTPTGAERNVLRPRTLIYGLLLSAAVIALAWSFTWRPELRINVIRDRSVMARQWHFGDVENVYRLQLMNATETSRTVSVRLADVNDLDIEATPAVNVDAAQAVWVVLRVRMSAAAALQNAGRIQPIHLELVDAANHARIYAHAASTFVVPR